MLDKIGLNRWRDDLAGGLAAAGVALPLALAFGVTSGAGPVAGLYSAICVGLFAALFGGTPTQIAGLKVGRYIHLLPYPVISGLTSGIGCILVIMQLDPLVGHPPQQGIVASLAVLPGYVGQYEPQAPLLGGVSFAILSVHARARRPPRLGTAHRARRRHAARQSRSHGGARAGPRRERPARPADAERRCRAATGHAPVGRRPRARRLAGDCSEPDPVPE